MLHCAFMNEAERHALDRRGSRRLNAYFWAFDPTGEPAIDDILAAVACAGKAYHSTEDWEESIHGWGGTEGPSWWELIQNAANAAADAAADGRING